MKNILMKANNRLLTNMLVRYSNTAYPNVTGFPNLDDVPDSLWRLWYSTSIPSFSTITKHYIHKSNTNRVKLVRELLCLNHQLKIQFSKL